MRDFVAEGGGLVVLAEEEQDKYGNNLAELLARVDDDHPTAEVELAGVTVPIDLRRLLGD